MGKLGKKARKFAKKNLGSVLKQRRQHRSMVMRRKSFRSRSHNDNEENAEKYEQELLDQTRRDSEGVIINGAISEKHFDNIFSDDENLVGDLSDSDGSLSEDPECPYLSESESENENDSQDKSHHADILGKNKEVSVEIAKQKKRLARLREKDPKFAEFLESRRADLEQLKNEDTSSDEEGDKTYPDGSQVNESLHSHDEKVLTRHTLDVWCWLVMEEPNGSVLVNLLNGFRAASRYIADSDDSLSQRITDKEVFSKLLSFVLWEADGLFRMLLRISDSWKKESILKLENVSEWPSVKPLVKSYFRSCLFLLNQISDSQVLAFVLSRLRASTMLFAAFPSIAGRLIKISVHLWATGDEKLSLSSFLMIRDIASLLGSECLDTCLMRTSKAFISLAKFVGITDLKHIEFLADSVVELYSLDVQKSYPKVLAYVQQLTNELRQALRMKNKGDLEKIYNWQFIGCINLWVKYISINIKDHDLQPLLFLVIEIIRGMTYLFPSPRYLPLRFRCVQMLNQLSSSSGVFIPVASLVLDCLDNNGNGKANAARGKPFDILSVLKAPKQWLKSKEYQGGCILTAVELLATHFAQWSFHVSFPEMATIPLIVLKRFHDEATSESLRRPVKRLIDQVQRNIEFIERKRDEVTFSPNDQASVDRFLQMEKVAGANAPFTQYFASVLQNSNLRSALLNGCSR